MVSISASLLSGKAARRLWRPVRCSGSHGPAVRMKAPAMLLTAMRSQRRMAASSSATLHPAAAFTACLRRSNIHRRPRCQVLGEVLGQVMILEIHNDLAEHLPGFEAREAALEIRKRNLGVDHRQQSAGHLSKHGADISDGSAERAEDLVLLLEQLHQIERSRRPRGGPAGDEPAAALEREEGAVECLGTGMLEHHVDALLGGDLPHDVLEAVGAVVDHMVSAERSRLFGLGVVADRGDDGAADRLRHPDGGTADPRARGMDQDRFAGSELGIVEKHVLDSRECDRRAREIAHRNARRRFDDKPRRHGDGIAGEAVHVEAHDAADILAQIVAALAARLTDAAGQPTTHHHRIPGRERGYAGTDGRHLACRLGAHHQRQLALGEGHAAVTPQIEVIEPDRLDAHLDLARAGRRRRCHVGKLKLAVGNKSEGAHVGSGLQMSRAVGGRRRSSASYSPPMPRAVRRGWPRRMRGNDAVVCPTIGRHATISTKIRSKANEIRFTISFASGGIVGHCWAISLVTLTTVMACVAAAAQDRDAFLARQTINCPGCNLGAASLDHRDLTGADLSGADLRGATFSRTVLRAANLAGANLVGAPLKRHDLTGANLSGANLEGATLHRAILRAANLSGANLAGANLNATILTSAKLQRAKLVQALLFQIDAGGADFTGADLSAALMGSARLIVARLDGANLTFADLWEARLTSASLRGATLTDANLHAATLLRADLSGATGERTNLTQANMRTAKLSGAMLRGADFFQADLVEADLSRADLGLSRLSAAKLFNAIQTDTKFEGAIMPDNSVHP